MDDQATVSSTVSDEELKKRCDTRPALEDCTLDVLDDCNTAILPNSVQLVESELPLSEAENCDKLSGVFLFRQIFSSYDNTLQCLFCRNRYSLRFPADLEKHYRVIHELTVFSSKAEFRRNIVFVCVPSDVNEETILNSDCRFCYTTLKTLSEIRDHYPNAHNMTVRLVPESDVTEIRNFFYCALCGHPSVDFPSHHQHMKVMHKMQTYVCRYCTYCTSRPSRLRTHVKQRHLQDQPGPHLQCSIMPSHAVQTDFSLLEVGPYERVESDDELILSCCENMDDQATVSSTVSDEELKKRGYTWDQPGPQQCFVTSVYVHEKDRVTKHIMLDYAEQTAAVTGCCTNKMKTVKGDEEFLVVSYDPNGKWPVKLHTSSFSSITKDPLDALQINFHEVIKDIQDELEQSNFIVRFKEDFQNVLNEWDLSHAITNEDSDSTDLSNYPNGSSLMGEKMQGIDIVCYGLGRFLSCIVSRYQLGFLLALKCILKSIHVYIYDPEFSTQEINFLKELKLNVIDINEEAKRTLGRKCVCFMPHVGLPLFNNLLWANWSAKGLSRLVVIGNRFQNYELNDRLKEKAKYVYLAKRFVTEIRMSNVFHFFNIFNDLSIHYFKSSSLSLVDPFVWTDLEEPECYGSQLQDVFRNCSENPNLHAKKSNFRSEWMNVYI